MFPNLRAEMTRNGIKVEDIASVLGISEKTARNYLSGRTKISWLDVLAIKEELFPELELEYLFKIVHQDDEKRVS